MPGAFVVVSRQSTAHPNPSTSPAVVSFSLILVCGCHRWHTLHILSQDVESDMMPTVPMTSVMAMIDCVSMSGAKQPSPTTRAGEKQDQGRAGGRDEYSRGIVHTLEEARAYTAPAKLASDSMLRLACRATSHLLERLV